ncbi:MAG: EcsC family protein [Xanthobacteraceae bacterium]|nr:EcsC family protein [Xanthobacteraceae bacterium]
MAALISLDSDADAPLAPAHEKALRRAVVLLENPNFAARLAEYAGQPVDKLVRMMPQGASTQLNRAVELAMFNCLKLAIRSLDPAKTRPPSVNASSLLAGVSGGVSGFFGAVALAVELPVTTTLMLRAIADFARHNGEDLSTLEARLACVEVFGLTNGSSRKRLDVGYYASRTLLTRLTQDASALLVERGVANAASTTVVNSLVTEIASRFGLVVSERAAASAMPIIGAVGGATVNMIFMNHFQRLAHGHFTIRRLERRYGSTVVQRRYEVARAELLKR